MEEFPVLILTNEDEKKEEALAKRTKKLVLKLLDHDLFEMISPELRRLLIERHDSISKHFGQKSYNEKCWDELYKKLKIE